MRRYVPLIIGLLGVALLVRQWWLLQTYGIALPASFHWPHVFEFGLGMLGVAGWFSGLWKTLLDLCLTPYVVMTNDIASLLPQQVGASVVRTKVSPSPVRFFGWILAGAGIVSLVGMVLWTVMGIRIARDTGTVSPALAQFVALAPIPLVLALFAVFGGALLFARSLEAERGC